MTQDLRLAHYERKNGDWPQSSAYFCWL